MNRNRWITLFLGSMALLAFLGWLFFREAAEPAPDRYLSADEITAAYDVQDEVAAARQRLASGEEATVLCNDLSGQKKLAITFDGMADRKTMLNVIDVLKRNGITAAFFIEGMNGAANPDVVQAITKAGFLVGNFTWLGESNMEKMASEKRVTDFCRSQKALADVAGAAPSLLKCSRSVYTKELLQDAKACGITSVVKNDSSFQKAEVKDEAAALNFVRSLKSGTIISVRLGTPVEAVKYEPKNDDASLAVDKQPGLKESITEGAETEIALTDALENFFAALKKENWQTDDIMRFRRIKYIPQG
jgi:peptidoglycan/xylan/chitin deacetylase (PgdA/CDA1 family)